MNKPDMYSDIKESIEKYFEFLKDFGFSEFEEKQLAYELHFETKNSFVVLDIVFEAITSTPIWATINGYYLDYLELKNPKIEAYKTEHKEAYDELFKQYLKTSNNKILEKISKQYEVNGKEINDNYLKELSEVLKRHINTLSGDLELLKSNTETVEKERELSQAFERIRNGTYTLEYQIFSNDDYDAFEEFGSIKDIQQYLVEQIEIKKYRVLDCSMNEIDLEV